MYEYSPKLAAGIGIGVVVIAAVATLIFTDRYRPLGAMPADERGDAKMFVFDRPGDAKDYLLYDKGNYLATIRAGGDDALSIVRVRENEIMLVRDSIRTPFHQGNIVTVARADGTVTEHGEFGTYWGLTADEAFVVFSDADDESGMTSIHFESFDLDEDPSFPLAENILVEQIETSPDGTRMIIAVEHTETKSDAVLGSIYTLNIASGSVSRMASLSFGNPADVGHAYENIILRWNDETHAAVLTGPGVESVIPVF